MIIRRYIIIGVTLLACLAVQAQRFFNLTAKEVRIDSLLPVFTYKQPLPSGYADSVYHVTIQYPEFVPMSADDIQRYQQISGAPLPALPQVSQLISVDRKQGELVASFVPLVFRDGQYQKLVSFMLEVKGEQFMVNGRRAAAGVSRYADHSVLASGRWVKISVPSTGVYQLTDEVVRQAGFTNFNKVKIYGYGGAMQPELLTGDYLTATDDLKEVPTCEVNGRRLFYGVGPVSWDVNNRRIRNPYSSYGYYFLTENDDEPLKLDADAFLASFYPSAYDHHVLYEVDDYAWYHGGRNLYDSRTFTVGTSRDYTLTFNGSAQSGRLTVALTAYSTGTGNNTTADILVNGTKVGSISILPSGSYDAT